MFSANVEKREPRPNFLGHARDLEMTDLDSEVYYSTFIQEF